MASKKQIFARQRNWAKARLLGMTFDPKIFSEDEKIIIAQIQTLKGELVRHWDINSAKLGLTPSKYVSFHFGGYIHKARRGGIVLGDHYIKDGFKEVFRGSGFTDSDYKVISSTDPSIQSILDDV